MEVRTAGSVAGAIAQLRDGLVNAVVLDLMLPDGNGSDVLRNLRESNSLARVCVVTAATDARILERVNSLKPDCVLRKPIDVDQLLNGLTPTDR
jgi:two-component system response regulator QseB